MQFWLKVLLFVTVILCTVQCNPRRYGDEFSTAKTTASRAAHKRDYSHRSENVKSSVGNHKRENNYYSNSHKSESEFSAAESHSVSKRVLSNGFGGNDESLVTAGSVTSNFESEKSQSQSSSNSVNYSNGINPRYSLQKESSSFLKRAEASSSTSSLMSSTMTGLNINNNSVLDSNINQGLLAVKGDNTWAKESVQSQGQWEKKVEEVSNHLYENSMQHNKLEEDISNNFHENSHEYKKSETDVSDQLHETSHSHEESQIDMHENSDDHKKYDLDISGNSYENSHEHKTYDLGFLDQSLENSNLHEKDQIDIVHHSHENSDEHEKYDLAISDHSLENSHLHEEAQLDISHHSHEGSDEHKKYNIAISDHSHDNSQDYKELSLNISDHSHENSHLQDEEQINISHHSHEDSNEHKKYDLVISDHSLENSHLHEEAQLDISYHSHESSDEHKKYDLAISDHSQENSHQHNELNLNISHHSLENSHAHDEAEMGISHHSHSQEHTELDLEISDHSYENSSHSHEVGQTDSSVHSNVNRIEHNINQTNSEENWTSLESFEICNNDNFQKLSSGESSNLEKFDQEIQQQTNVSKTNNLHITESQDLKPELLYPDMESEVKYSDTFEDFDEAGTPDYLMSSEENKELPVTEASIVKPDMHILPHSLYPMDKFAPPKSKDEIYILPNPNRSGLPEKKNGIPIQPYPYPIVPNEPKPEDDMPILPPHLQPLDKSGPLKPNGDVLIQSNPSRYPTWGNAPYQRCKHPYYLMNRQTPKPFNSENNDYLDENNQWRNYPLGFQEYRQPFQPQAQSMNGYPKKELNPPQSFPYYPARSRYDNYPQEYPYPTYPISGPMYQPYPSDQVLPPRPRGKRHYTPEKWYPNSLNEHHRQSSMPEERYKSQPLQVLSQTKSPSNGPVSPLSLLKPLSHTLNKSLSGFISPSTSSGIYPKSALLPITAKIYPKPISLSTPTAVLPMSELPSIQTDIESTPVFVSPSTPAGVLIHPKPMSPSASNDVHLRPELPSICDSSNENSPGGVLPSTPTGIHSRPTLSSTPVNIYTEPLLPSTSTGVYRKPILPSTPTGVPHEPICNCDKFSSSFTSPSTPAGIYSKPPCHCSHEHPACNCLVHPMSLDSANILEDTTKVAVDSSPLPLTPESTASPLAAKHNLNSAEPVISEVESSLTLPSPIVDQQPLPSPMEIIKPLIPDNTLPTTVEKIISLELPTPGTPCEEFPSTLPTAPADNLPTPSLPVRPPDQSPLTRKNSADLSYVLKDLETRLEAAKLESAKLQKHYPKDITQELEIAEESSLSYPTVIIGSHVSALSALKPLLERGKPILLIDNVELPPVEAASLYHRIGLIGTPYVTSYAATAPQCDTEKKVHVPHVLGGTLTYDLGIWDYGAAQQYEKWGNACLNWSWDILSKYYQQLEKRENAEGSCGGPVNVRYTIPQTCFTSKLITAYADVGIEETKCETGSPRQHPGLTVLPSMHSENYSSSFAQRIFEEIGNQEHLTVALGVQIKRIVFEGRRRRRAVGVEFITSAGQIRTIRAADELIIAHEPVNTIRLLQVSGLGDGYYLQRHRIPVQQHLPFVGKDVLLYPMYPGLLIKCAPGSLVEVWDSDYSAIGSLFAESNMQSTVASTYFKAFMQVYDAEEANLQINVYTFSRRTVQRLKYFMRGLFDFDDDVREYLLDMCSDNDLMFFVPQLLDTESKAEVRVDGADYATPPIIETNLYDNERDLLVMRKAVSVVKRVAGNLIQQVGGELVQVPAEKCGQPSFDKTFLECSIRRLTVPSLHLTGGTVMGYDEYSSVVDENLRVHGVQNLYIVGPSVIPNGLSADSSAISSVIGRYGADLIIGDHQQQPIPESL